MFKPKKTRGGSYIIPKDSSGYFPTEDELFNLSSVQNIQSTTADIKVYIDKINQNTSTIDGYTHIVNVLSHDSSILYTNMVTANTAFNIQKQLYNSQLQAYSTLSSQYMSTDNVDYMLPLDAYIRYSTIEHLSIAQIISDYSLPLSTTADYTLVYAALDDVLSVRIPQQVNNISNYPSSISTYTQRCLDDSLAISTLVSTIYNPWHSTIESLSSQLSIAIHVDSVNADEIQHATSTHQHYVDDQRNRMEQHNQYITDYNRDSVALGIQSVICSTTKDLYDFQVLQSSIMNAEILFNSTAILKSELDHMITLEAQGQNVTNYFNTVMSGNMPVQAGGDQVSNMLNTINVLYSQYSTMVVNLTDEQQSKYPNMTADEVNSYITQTGFESIISQYKYNVEYNQAIYEGILPSTQIISSLMSFNQDNYSMAISTGITDKYVADSLATAVHNYSTVLMKKLQDVQSTQQNIYTYEASSFILKGELRKEKDIIEQAVRNYELIGSVYTSSHSGITQDSIGRYAPELLNLRSTIGSQQGGLLADLEAQSTTQFQQRQLILSTLQQISAGTLTLSTATAGQLFASINSKAAAYNAAAVYANTNISTQLSCEMNIYINTLEYLSTTLVTNLLMNALTIEGMTYNNAGVINLTTIPQSTTLITTLSTNSAVTHSIIKDNDTFINMLFAEAIVKQYYITQKSKYDTQSYYRVISATPDMYPNLMNSYDFDTLTTLYDLSIQNVNRYVNNRQTQYNTFINTLGMMSTNLILDPSLQFDLQTTQHSFPDNTTNLSISTIYIISSILPLMMNFTNVPARTVLFQSKFLPDETPATCPVVSASSLSIVQDITPYNINTLHSTPDTATYGVRGRFVRIQRPDNNVEILQILVIDSTGKNVAFGATVTTAGFNRKDASNNDINIIVNGTYNINTLAPSFISGATFGLVITKTLWIDLGAVYDITAIQYLKGATSSYNSQGFIVQIFAADQLTPVSNSMLTGANTSSESLDFRVKTTKAVTGDDVPMFLTNLRQGVCGILARYVRIRPSSSGILQISQIAVVSSDGTNIAAGLPATYAAVATPFVTDGTYHSRPASSCYTITNMPANAYIQIDLGTEKDITAVQLYNTTQVPSYQFGTVIDLYTGDNQLAIEKPAITNNMKEIIDFRYAGSAVACPTEMNWPAYYGTAGIIARYVGLRKTDSTVLGFSKLQIIDKSGRDVGLYKPVTVTSSPNLGYLGVTNYVGPQPVALSYTSVAGPPNQQFVVDLQQDYEICAVNVFACSDGSATLLQNTNLEFYSAITPATTGFFSKPVSLTGLSSFFDTRYDPEDSAYPTTIDTTLTSYGLLGTLATSVSIPGNPTGIQITEGTGQDLYPTSTKTTDTTGITTIVFTKNASLLEVNSVIVTGPSTIIGKFVYLYGCNGVIVNSQPLQNYTDSITKKAYILADFRNPSKNLYAPMTPLPMIYYSGLPTTAPNYGALSTMYGAVNLDTGSTNSPPKGVLTRYVKIIPADAVTPLYISQIVVIDSNGINVAFEKDTFTPNGGILSTTGKAVDGVFALSIDNPNYSILGLADYVSRPVSSSFVSVAGPQELNYYVIDLGMEYFVNSVIYVSASQHFSAGQGVIVELHDANLITIGVKLVSQYVALFGVDVLDFRVDRTELVTDPGAWLEVRPRIVQLGLSGCGMMGQYIRIVSASGGQFTLSQIIVTDPNGNNIARYKPTYSSTNSKDAYKIVDGAYYQRIQQYAYTSIPNNAFIDYVEVNFGNEVEITNLFVVNTQGASSYSDMIIKVYNVNRDVIATLNLGNTSLDYSNITLNSDHFFFPSNLNNNNTLPVYNTPQVNGSPLPVIGVNILTRLAPFAIVGGLTQSSSMPSPNAPAIPVNSTFPARVNCTASPVSLSNIFTRGPNGGVPCRYIRVYNANRYIHVSQIMVYGFNGINYAYNAKCTAISVFPGTYIQKVTDGNGGYFHNPRASSDCFKSGGKKYDFLQVDIGLDSSGNEYEIVGVRCIFASDNIGDNLGAQIQILNNVGGVPGFILRQHIVDSTELQEALIDFRLPPVNTTIAQIIMPKIFSVGGLPSGLATGGPNGMVEGANGTVYIVDTVQHCIWSSTGTGLAPFFGTKGVAKTETTTVTGLNYPVGIVTDGTFFYISDYGNGRIVRVNINGTTPTVFASPPNPYGLFYTNGTLYCTCNGSSGLIYSYNTVGTTVQTSITPSQVIPFPNSIVAIGLYYYISSGTTGLVYRVANSSPYAVTPFIGKGATVTLPLISISAIVYDVSENVLFIADYVQDKIFAVTNLLAVTPVTYNLAGSGNGGYTGDGSQGIFATMDGPISLMYSPSKGFLYISDYKNNTVRYLQLYSNPSVTILTTTTNQQWPSWTTTTLAPVVGTVAAPVAVAPTNIQFTQLTSPALISNVTTSNITAVYIKLPTLYCAIASSLYSVSLTGLGTANYKFTTTPITPSPQTTFGTITCIVANSSGTALYVCDSTNNVIYNIVLASKTITKYIGSTGATIIATPSLNTPTWIGFDTNGTLYITDTGNYCIRRLNGLSKLEVYVGVLGGSAKTTVPILGEVYGIQALLNAPGAFVFDSNNNLIFVDSGTNTIYKVGNENRMSAITYTLPSSTTAPFSDTFYTASSFPTNAANIQLRNPYGITIDSADSLYITAQGGQQIVKFTLNTIYVPTVIAGFGSDSIGRSVATDTNAYNASLNGPTAIVCDPVSKMLLFMDAQNTMLRMILPPTYTPYQVNAIIPYGPLISIANDTKNTYNTTVVSSTSPDENLGILENFQADFVCTSTTGTLYFPNTLKGKILLNATILKQDSSGNLTVIGKGFSMPEGIALYNDSVIYVADASANAIYSITLSTGTKSSILNITTPYALAINPIGYLFYSYMNSTTPTIGIYNLRKSSAAAVTAVTGVLTFPNTAILALTVDSDGNLYVAVTVTSQIGGVPTPTYSIYKYPIIYTASGLTLGSRMTVPTSGGPYKGITFSNGNLYYSSTADSSVYSIQVLPTIGTAAATTLVIGQNKINGPPVDGSYSHTTSLNGPLGICIDSNGGLYILDTKTSGNTILLKNTTYNIIQQGLAYTVAGTNLQGTPSTYITGKPAYFEVFNQIGGVCYDSLGQTYISDTGNHCISKIDLSGNITTFAGMVGQSGLSGDGGSPTAAKLNGPTDIKMSKSNILYIADTGNGCIRRVKPVGTGYQISTFGSAIKIGGTSIAIDSYENVYIIAPLFKSINIITQLEQVTLYFSQTGLYNINNIAINSANVLYYIANNSVYKAPSTIILTGFSNITYLCFDASDNLYISDNSGNYIYMIPKASIPATSTVITPSYIIVGNGSTEPSFTSTDNLQNIYGSGLSATKKAVSSPGPLAIYSTTQITNLLIGQPTKVTLYNITTTTQSNTCGMPTTSVVINNPGNNPIYLSQIVVLNSDGMNVALGTFNPYTNSGTNLNYNDGFYGCKYTTEGATAAAAAVMAAAAEATAAATATVKAAEATAAAAAVAAALVAWPPPLCDPAVEAAMYAAGTAVATAKMTLAQAAAASVAAETMLLQVRAAAAAAETTASQARAAAATAETMASKDVAAAAATAPVISTAYTINPKSSLTVTIPSSNIVAILLYLGDTGKTDWNGATITLNSDTSTTRTITKMANIPSLQYITLDYRKKTTACAPFNYYISKYKLQDTPTTISTSYVQNFIRYIRIGSSTIIPNTFPVSIINKETGANLTPSSSLQRASDNSWIEYNLNDEYTIEQVIIQIPGSYTVTGYTTTRAKYSLSSIYSSSAVNTYSLDSPSGIKRTRYIKYISNGTHPIQISQIIAIDMNGINVAYGKSVSVLSTGGGISASVVNTGSAIPVSTPYISATSGTAEYLQIDLGQEYEIQQIIYVNATTNQTYSIGCTVHLLDTNSTDLKSYTLLSNLIYINGSTTLIEGYVVSIINPPQRSVSLKYSKTVSIDYLLIRLYRGRIVKIGDSGGITNTFLTINVPIIYDIYGRTIGAGKPTSGLPGSGYTIDLLDTYYIKDILVTYSYTGTQPNFNIPYAIYDYNNAIVFSGTVYSGTVMPVYCTTFPTFYPTTP